MDGVETLISDKDIMAGTAWRSELLDMMKEAEFCIVCLERQSLRSPWIAFEVGFVANSLAESSICPYLIGLSPRNIERHPLSKYQAKQADKEGTWDLILALERKQHGPNALREQRLRERFELYWEHQLTKEFAGLLTGGAEAEQPTSPAPQKRVEPEQPSPPTEPGPQRLIVPPTEPEAEPKPAPPFRLSLFNTSFYPRKGHVTHDWQSIFDATGIPPEEVVVRDERGHELPAQVDYFEHSDPTQAALVFSLLNEIIPVPEDYSAPSSYVTIERGVPRQWPNQPQLKIEEPGGRARRVRLSNDRLEILLELKPKPWDDKDKEWYAGAATTVLLDGKEILDAFNWLDMPDIEKRCMQLDRLQLLYPNGDEIWHEHFDLIRNWYQLISTSSGPVRSIVTIASQLFNYNYTGLPNQREQWSKCRLYRVISLYKGANYITEELKVYGTHGVGLISSGVVPLDFNTRYFSYMDMGLDPSINMYQKWFTISTAWAPYQGYGFATSADLPEMKVENPDPKFKSGDKNEHKTFLWKLRRRKEEATCLHLFTRDTPKELESEVRRAWHEVIDRPLAAKIKL
ncbi:MAG: hypothetical protein DMF66_00395 [Acidobacteria bacterium]|nr:MAG: hypothetical protein DMF66_00395 [Acidobacteriota bacterium]